MKKVIGRFLMVSVAVAAIGMGSQAKAIPVDLELSLLVDVSGSVSNAEFALQRDAYVAAFNDAGIISAIQSGSIGSIAANFIYWSGSAQQSQVVGWTQISDAATGTAFANAIFAAARPFSGSTAPGSALNFATPLFNANGFEGTREVIDVSGDGAQNNGANTLAASNAAIGAGIDAINGIVIGGQVSVFNFYVNNIQNGAGAFTLTANSFADFAAALDDKLVREITGGVVPEPITATLGLMGLGALATVSRRRRAA